VLPDQDRDMHDHPWNARTVILRGWYTEERLYRPTRMPAAHPRLIGSTRAYLRSTGDTATLAFGEYHKITRLPEGGCWTLFITGPYRGNWGFLVDGVKVQWRKYLGIEK